MFGFKISKFKPRKRESKYKEMTIVNFSFINLYTFRIFNLSTRHKNSLSFLSCLITLEYYCFVNKNNLRCNV